MVIQPELDLITNIVANFEIKEKQRIKEVRVRCRQIKREEAAIIQAHYKATTKRFYNYRVRQRACKVGDLVLKKNEASRVEKG